MILKPESLLLERDIRFRDVLSMNYRLGALWVAVKPCKFIPIEGLTDDEVAALLWSWSCFKLRSTC